ncbi:hypothetical protein X737_37340 [Mesorhizobium sp. L48C026A00]|nr:hypothetical protein X737_37340 [Mesorhizobium sp. L48C026A00]
MRIGFFRLVPHEPDFIAEIGGGDDSGDERFEPGRGSCEAAPFDAGRTIDEDRTTVSASSIVRHPTMMGASAI